MENNKNIIVGKSLNAYKKKYRNRNYKLLKFTKSEIDKLDPLEKKHLLENRKWWLIDNNYYEIPKFPRITWFRNLSAGVQACTWILGVGAVTTGVVVPIVLTRNKVIEINLERTLIEVEEKSTYIFSKKVDLKAGYKYVVKADFSSDFRYLVANNNYFFLGNFDIAKSILDTKTFDCGKDFSIKNNKNTFTYFGTCTEESGIDPFLEELNKNKHSFGYWNFESSSSGQAEVIVTSSNSFNPEECKVEVSFVCKQSVSTNIYLTPGL